MKQNQSLRILTHVFILVSVLVLAFSCSMFDEAESEISGVDKIACQQFNDSSFFELSLVELTEFDTSWTNDQVVSNIPAILDSLLAHDIVVHAGLDSAYWITRAGDSSYVALESGISEATIFYTDMLDLNIYDPSGSLVEFNSDQMPLETISGCRFEDVETFEGNIIKVRLEYTLPGSLYLMHFSKTETSSGSDFYLTIQNSN